MKNINTLRGLYLICHIAIIPAILLGSFSWCLCSIATYFVLQILGLSVGLHRYFAHKSFNTGKYRELFLLLFATITAMGSPISWAGVHRFHHLHSDTDKDPHSPHKKSLWHILLGLYNKNIKIPPSLIKDLLKSPALLFVHKHYFKILAVWAFCLFLIGGSKALIFIFCIPIVFIYWATAIGLILVHTQGYRNFETIDRSVNSWLVSLYTLGDGWHNNHHKYPDRYKHGLKWWELDLSAVLISWFFQKKLAYTA